MQLKLVALLPYLVAAVSALQIPHLPTPQEALRAADSVLHGSIPSFPSANGAETVLSYANDMKLSMIGGDDHVVITHAKYPVGLFSRDTSCY